MIQGRDLGNQDWHNARQRSRAEAGDHLGYEDEVEALSGALEGATDESEDGSEEDSVDATDPVGDPASNEAAHHGTKIILHPLSDTLTLYQRLKRTHNADDASLRRRLGHGTIW